MNYSRASRLAATGLRTRGASSDSRFAAVRTTDQAAIEIVHAHAGINDDSLGVDPGGAEARETPPRWPLLQSRPPGTERRLLGIEIGIYISGNAGRGRSF